MIETFIVCHPAATASYQFETYTELLAKQLKKILGDCAPIILSSNMGSTLRTAYVLAREFETRVIIDQALSQRDDSVNNLLSSTVHDNKHIILMVAKDSVDFFLERGASLLGIPHIKKKISETVTHDSFSCAEAYRL